MKYYIGLMTGTSIDAIDAVIVDLENTQPNVISTLSVPIATELRTLIETLITTDTPSWKHLSRADHECALAYTNAILTILDKANLPPSDIIAAGCHGQTIHHNPSPPYPYTVQIGDPNKIAELTKLNIVAQFRQRDLCVGGQGAPLAPLFHQYAFHCQTENRMIINIGGIANVTYLPSNADRIVAFDSGPGNTLIDAWCLAHKQTAYDSNGQWASSGELNTELLNAFLHDPYFALQNPKSTGREYFNLKWVEKHLKSLAQQDTPTNIQTTLTHVTAKTIVNSIKALSQEKLDGVYICGGGAYNTFLLKLIQSYCGTTPVYTTAKLGIAPQWVEAMAFAWLAKQRIEQKAVLLENITGSKSPIMLGTVYV